MSEQEINDLIAEITRLSPETAEKAIAAIGAAFEEGYGRGFEEGLRAQ